MKGVSYITVASIIFTAFNLVQGGVREVEFLSTVIYGQAIGSFNVTANDHKHIGSIQGSPHDAGSLLVPVGPEHETIVGNKHRTSIMMCSGRLQNVKCLGIKVTVEWTNINLLFKRKKKEILMELGHELQVSILMTHSWHSSSTKALGWSSPDIVTTVLRL